MAAQLAMTLSGFTGNLFADQEEMVEDADSDKVAAWQHKYLASGGKPSGKSSVCITQSTRRIHWSHTLLQPFRGLSSPHLCRHLTCVARCLQVGPRKRHIMQM